MFKVAVAALLSLCLASQALAGPQTIRSGSFRGYWCDYPVIYVIRGRELGRPVYHGAVIFPALANQIDGLTIEQFGDYSLRMTRTMTGKDAGILQIVETYTPTLQLAKRLVFARFEVRTAEGPKCDGKLTRLDLK